MDTENFKHHHACWHSNNKQSYVQMDSVDQHLLVISGYGISANVLLNGFKQLYFYSKDVDDEYEIEIYGYKNAVDFAKEATHSNMYKYLCIRSIEQIYATYVVKITSHDDCFFTIESPDHDMISTLLRSILKMHFAYLTINKLVFDDAIIDKIVKLLYQSKKCYFYSLGQKVVISKKSINPLRRFFRMYRSDLEIK